MKGQIIELKFESIEPEGKAVGHYNDKAIFCYGVLPSEIARVKIIKQKSAYCLCELVEIIKKSEFRIKEKEDHYIACSPWQIMTYDYQTKLKKENIINVFKRFAKTDIFLNDFICDEKNIFSYRTKIEYSLYKDDDGYFFAFHKRGSVRGLIKSKNGCVLASDYMNSAGEYILKKLNEFNFERNVCKTLTLRESKLNHKVIGVLAVKTENFPNIEIKPGIIDGLIIAYSNPLTPSSQIHKILHKNGDEFLKEELNNYKIKYNYDCFFQNNVELFERAVDKIEKNINKDEIITELYSGVSTIGIMLSKKAKFIYGIEENKNSINYARQNFEANNIKKYEIIENAVENQENLLEILEKSDFLILDPPRTGLHKNVIESVLKSEIKKIAYLSCNPITQARDFELLKQNYKINYCAGFDFYPNTPHVETLIILEKI